MNGAIFVLLYLLARRVGKTSAFFPLFYSITLQIISEHNHFCSSRTSIIRLHTVLRNRHEKLCSLAESHLERRLHLIIWLEVTYS